MSISIKKLTAPPPAEGARNVLIEQKKLGPKNESLLIPYRSLKL
jgi:hypothetical protein